VNSNGKELSGQAIIVTGGASGIGRATCHALADMGADVVVADIDLAGAESVASALEGSGVQAHPCHVDVSIAEQVEALVELATASLGRLTGIFNNAGIGMMKPFLELDPDSYHKLISINQHGVYYGMYYAARRMVEHGSSGTIVNTASIYGVLASSGTFNYNAAKAAVIMMTKSGALELAEHGIRVVGIAPGFVETAMMVEDPDLRDLLARQQMRKRLIQPEKVASVVAFLFSDAAEALNGQTIPVDDGFLSFKG
jgi:NAD(P)-dependent dehydrogenase (short-subunit alcohol dehydrogenase family)